MKDLKWRAVVAGVGGQGVLFATRALAKAAQERADKVFISEVHGMAQRGGSVVSYLKAGPFATPMIAEGWAELLFALESGEAVRNVGCLAHGSKMVVNAADLTFLSPEARSVLDEFGVRSTTVDATALAQEAGAPRGANVILLGAAAAAGALPFSYAELLEVLRALTPPQRWAMNEKLYATGGRAIRT